MGNVSRAGAMVRCGAERADADEKTHLPEEERITSLKRKDFKSAPLESGPSLKGLTHMDIQG